MRSSIGTRVLVEPHVATIDVARRIRLLGFAPGERVTVFATLRQNDASTWRSEARFVADTDGQVDVATARPLSGTYAEASPMGLVWSMAQTGAALPPGMPFDQTAVQTVRLRAEAPSGNAEGSFEQHFLAPGVQVMPIRDGAMVATLFVPPDAGPHPLVVVLSGSGGGLVETRAALFAAHGYAALALGYFGAPGLPPRISQTPLEYFADALRWARRTLTPAGGFIALCGQSRGGELALLLGATMPEDISAIVAYVPSSVTHGVLNAGRPGEARDAPTWTWDGQAVAAVERDNPRLDWRPFDDAPGPKRQTPVLLAAMEDAQSVARSSIAVEGIRGPVMLISGRDDAMWPSSRYAELVEERLANAKHPFPVAHRSYEDAGHTITYPFVPTTVLARPHPMSGVDIAFGGAAAANARAGADSWPAVLEFLAAARAAA